MTDSNIVDSNTALETARPGHPLMLSEGTYFELARTNGRVDTLALSLPAAGDGAEIDGLSPQDILFCVSRNLEAAIKDGMTRGETTGRTRQAKRHVEAALGLLQFPF